MRPHNSSYVAVKRGRIGFSFVASLCCCVAAEQSDIFHFLLISFLIFYFLIFFVLFDFVTDCILWFFYK